MASSKVLEEKKAVVEEITNKIKDSESVILFTYQGLTVSELSSLRRELKKADAEVCVYKNTLVKRALDDLKIDLDGFLEGPNAILFGKELLEPIKILSKFAKENDKAEIRVGIISGAKADLAAIKEYATIPSREGLLTMLAGGMIQYVKELAIGLNMYADKLEK
jgi:large subunit ribosomal protein L10